MRFTVTRSTINKLINMDALLLHSISHFLYKLNVPILPKLIQILIYLLCNSHIPYQATIGKGSKIGHRGIGVIINRESIIGNNVLIRAHVTIGKNEHKKKAPIMMVS